MTTPSVFPIEGGCDCRKIRYRMETAPLFVHCCHCRWCQRESGASFALNAMIEADRITLLAAEPELVADAVGERAGAGNRALPEMQDRAVEPLRRRRADGQIRPRRHARRARPPSARHPHLHRIEAAVGGDPRRHARRCRVLRAREVLACGKPCPARGHAAADQGVAGRTAARTLKLSMQSDMFMALIGAVTALALLSRTHDRQIGRLR